MEAIGTIDFDEFLKKHFFPLAKKVSELENNTKKEKEGIIIHKLSKIKEFSHFLIRKRIHAK